MRRDPTQFRERFKRWKSGEQVYDKGLPKFDDGKDSYRYYQDGQGGWFRAANDDMTRAFEGLVVTPRKTKYTYVPKKIDNSEQAVKLRDEYNALRDKYNATHNSFTGLPTNQSLEIVSPEFDLIGLAPLAKAGAKMLGRLGNKVVNGIDNAARRIFPPSHKTSYSLSLKDALDDKNFDFSITGAPRQWWETMNRVKPEIALKKWNTANLYTKGDISLLDYARDIYNSDWYKRRLIASGINPDNVIPHFMKNIGNTTIRIGHPGSGFGMEALGKNVTTKTGNEVNNVITLSNDLLNNKNLLRSVSTHESLHASSGTGMDLPVQINNKILTPNFNRNVNPNYYNYMSVPDEQRVRLLRLADYVENNGGDYDRLIRRYKTDHVGFGKEGDSDFVDLLTSFDIEDVINAAKNVKGLFPIVGFGAAGSLYKLQNE